MFKEDKEEFNLIQPNSQFRYPFYHANKKSETFIDTSIGNEIVINNSQDI